MVLMNRENLGTLTWKDIPNFKEVAPELIKATRFAFVWLSNIAPELSIAKNIGEKDFRTRVGTSWFSKFFPASRGILGGNTQNNVDFNDPKEQDAIEIITTWCKDYLSWLSNIHKCQGESIQLFNVDYFNSTKLSSENLSDLIVSSGDSRDQNKKSQDTIQRLKERLNPDAINPPNKGIIGLAKALYHVCRLND